MPIQFRCQHCARLLSIGRRKAGCQIHCPTCKGMLTVPPSSTGLARHKPWHVPAPASSTATVELQPLPVGQESRPVPQHRISLPVALSIGLSLATGMVVLALFLVPRGSAAPGDPGGGAPPSSPPAPPVVTTLPPLPPPVAPVTPRTIHEPPVQPGIPGHDPAPPPRRRPDTAYLWYTGFKAARALAVDSTGRAYVSDSGMLYRKQGDARPVPWRKDPAGIVCLALDRKGHLLAGTARGQVVRIDPETREETVVNRRGDFDNQQPRRLVADALGGFYLCTTTAVYHVAADGTVRRQPGAPERPRALALSRDGKTIYLVTESGSDVHTHRVDATGMLAGRGTPWRLERATPGGLSDLAVDGRDGLHVLRDTECTLERLVDGKRRVTVSLPVSPIACASGGPGARTVYVLTRHALYTIDLEGADHR